MKSPLSYLLIGMIRTYQLCISPLLGRNCRFMPTCSEYALRAVERHGAIRGSLLAAGRLMRCGPWHPGGIDEVPDVFSFSGIFKANDRPSAAEERSGR